MSRRAHTSRERGYTINENLRGSRDTKRENCDRNPGTGRFMREPDVYVPNIYRAHEIQNRFDVAGNICISVILLCIEL